MGLIWWILPSIAGVVGLILLFAGFGKLANLKPFAGVARLAFGTGFLGLAGVVAFAGLNFQTYKRLTYERPVAVVKFTAVPGEAASYTADVTFSDGTHLTQADGTQPVFRGDEWQIGARVIKFKPMANILGYDSVYRIEHMRSTNSMQFSSEAVTEGKIDGIRIVTEEPGIDISKLADTYGSRFGIDAEYGSATYQPMGDGFEYEVSITQDALIARPTEATRIAIQSKSYPGFLPSKRTDR
ncbi:hypothetical protein K1X12_01445 [Hyphomonas sp. WL0036]|uniref:hypothetical protein n=1 Tax=Hyphomonas sediminis TaxID=2866160 RepID=UPI001C81D2D0|nr:hypothetical protein [Hyphomonas sediminis]MBY9065542.1 hypothetical protein [Hyphomonas sediminis]